MERTLEALTKLQEQWIQLKVQRPSEAAFVQFGYDGLHYGTIDDLMRSWIRDAEALHAKTRWIDTPDGLVADVAIAALANRILPNVINAQGNGVAWLLSSGFLEQASDLSSRISAIADRRTAVAKAIAKDMEAAGLEEMRSVREAAVFARELTDRRREVDTLIRHIETAEEKAQAGATSIGESADNLETARTEIDEAHEHATERKGEIEELRNEVVELRDQAEEKVSGLDRRLQDLTAKISNATTMNDEATGIMRTALRDVRQQGLAGAFTARSKIVFRERIAWAVAFVIAVAWLGVLAVWFALDLTTFNYEMLVVALLRRVALAAPLVWLGWYSAKQLVRLGRVQEDYEYKAATALAFQSYKTEVETLGDKDLVAELLETAIKTFGENPVRHYESAPSESVTPAGELIKTLENDDSFKLLKWLKSNLGAGGSN